MIKFQDVAREFRAYHRDALNVTLHLVTTPAGLLFFLSLLWRLSLPAAVTLVAAYLISLFFVLPRRLWAATALVTAPLLAAVWALDLTALESLVGLAACYVGQELAHHLTSERTFQSSYQKQPSWLRPFLEHTYYLLPLCLDAAWHTRTGDALLAWFTPKSGLLRTRLNTPGDLRDLDAVRAWVEEQNPPTDVTTHWWSNASAMRQTVARLADSSEMIEMFHGRYSKQIFSVMPLHEMNEIYVASMTHRNNSDTVFYTKHIDGPFMAYPFAAVYRCIVAVNENTKIKTTFPMTPAAVTLTTGDVGGFDFNREIHRIEHNSGADNPSHRITLKLHYCVYPKQLPWYGRTLASLTTRYDIAARKLFLRTLRPQGVIERVLARLILSSTAVYRFLAEHVGGGAIAYLVLLALADHFFAAPIFLYGASFVHYLLYIAVYHTRANVAFHTFKRRAMFWKGLAIAQLVVLYLSFGHFDPLSVSLIAVGVTLSTIAARVLGMERTYFAAELGLCEPIRLNRFPYGLIPHPMIVGNIISLLGFYALPEMRAAAPYLVPLHIALYLLHLLQEEGVIFKKSPPANEMMQGGEMRDTI